MTGFEPATTRPPDVDSTGLSYIPKFQCKCSLFFEMLQEVEGKKGNLFMFSYYCVVSH